MLDRTKRNRSYLFGRLLAIYDLIEKQKYYHVDGQQNARETNATRLWTALIRKAPKGVFLIFFVFWPTPKHTKWGLRPQTPFSLRKSKNL